MEEECRAHSEKYIQPGRMQWWDSEFLKFILEHHAAPDPANICDLGCGAGHWGLTLGTALSARPDYIGVDNDPHWIEQIRESVDLPNTFATVKAVEASAIRTGLPSDSFDLVTCQTLLLHLSDPVAAIHEMLRLCKPGGFVILAEPCNVLNRAQLFEAIQLLEPREAARMLEIWAIYHASQKRERGFDYDIALSMPEILAAAGVLDFWAFHNPKTYIHTLPSDSDLSAEYGPAMRDLVLSFGATAEMWHGARESMERLKALRPSRLSCVPSGLFLFGFKKSHGQNPSH